VDKNNKFESLMSHKETIQKKGFCIFDLSKGQDKDSITPLDSKYMGIFLCYQGEAVLELNMQNFKITKGTCLSIGNVLYKKTAIMSDDFKARVLICSKSFALDTAIGIPTGFIEALYAKPSVNVKDEKVFNLIDSHLNTLDILMNIKFGPKQDEMTSLTLRSLLLIIATTRGLSNKANKFAYQQKDVYYRNFVELIDEHVNHEHEVSFYAEKMNITPKYLSEICKDRSGHKAKEIISSFLISKIKQEIIMTQKSFKAIAYEYGFSDQSSMGKFFSNMTGMSPGDFRKANALVV